MSELESTENINFLRGMHNPPLVLVADDDKDFREIVAVKLKNAGFWVAEAADGDETVERAATLKPDVILLDINMPKSNGTEAFIDLEANAELKETKIFFLSNMKSPWPFVKADRPTFARELGAQDFIDKSEDLDKLVGRVRQALASK